jgi:hypothetical protein
MNERLNIRRMQVPEKSNKEELPFDADKELTEPFWNGVITELRWLQDHNQWPRALAIASSLTQLGRRDEFDIPPEQWEGIDKYIDKRGQLDADQNAQFLARVKIVDPTHELALTDDNWRWMISKFDALKQSGHWELVVPFAKNLKILQPHLEVLSVDDLQHIHAVLELQQTRGWAYFTTLVDALCALDPDNQPDITETDWRNMRHLLEQYIGDREWLNAVIQAAEMQSLARSQARRNKIEIKNTPVPETSEI